MLILGINTAGQGCDVVLMENNLALGQKQDPDARGQDVTLPALVRSVWTDAGIEPGQIDRIAVVTGPGSFTGIRLGVAFARGLALALEKPCLGITSLEASLPPGQQGSAMVLLPAQKRPPDITYWVQRFRSGTATTDPEECHIQTLHEELLARPHRLFGEATALQEKAADLPVYPARPTAARAAALAAERDPALHRPRPNYARAPDAVLPT
jgi:tRNA threonylcarbamoyladenosine biosynthesis protein TsaB